MEGQGLSGLFIGDYLSAWSGAADLSAERHIHWWISRFSCGKYLAHFLDKEKILRDTVTSTVTSYIRIGTILNGNEKKCNN